MVKHLLSKSILPTTSTAHNHQQNGMSEKLIQDLQRMARVSLSAADAPLSMFEEALRDACFKKNRLDRALIKCTPFEAYRGFKPNLEHIMKFGQKVMVHIPEERRSGKTSKRGEEGRIVGHTPSTVIYRVANPNWTTVKELTGVNKIVLQAEPKSVSMCEVLSLLSEDSQTNRLRSGDSISVQPSESSIESEKISEQTERLSDSEQNLATKKSEQQPAIQFQQFEFSINEESVIIPKSVKEMLNSPFKDFWIEACDQEVMAWMAMKVGHLVPRSEAEARSILRAHWVWSVKCDSDGKVTRFKARYVVDGSAVPESIFSPVINMTVMRSMLVYALKRKMIVHLIDIKNAFLNPLLNQDFFIEQIRLYEDPAKPTYILKLDKSVCLSPLTTGTAS